LYLIHNIMRQPPDAVRRDRDGQHVALGGEHVALASCTYEATAFAGRITISPMAASIWPRRLSRSAVCGTVIGPVCGQRVERARPLRARCFARPRMPDSGDRVASTI
jgi:hypothetical protein